MSLGFEMGTQKAADKTVRAGYQYAFTHENSVLTGLDCA
jgi:hypothetical protein